MPSEVSAMLIGISGHGVTPLQAPALSLAGGEQSAGSSPAAYAMPFLIWVRITGSAYAVPS